MNIIVRPYGSGYCLCRPDTSWERENKDIYPPDYVSGYMWAPVLFARISKAGKCIGQKFAGRYYDAVGYGILLYPSDLLDGSPEGYACASCIDHTSVLPFPMYDRVTLESGTNMFEVYRDGEEIYSTSEGSEAMIEEALTRISAMVSLRIGDIAAIELAPVAELAEKPGKTEVAGKFCGNELFRFNIIF